MRYGSGISKSKNRWAVPDDRLLQFAVPLTATHPLTDSAEQRQGKKLLFPGNKYRGQVIDQPKNVWYTLDIIYLLKFRRFHSVDLRNGITEH